MKKRRKVFENTSMGLVCAYPIQMDDEHGMCEGIQFRDCNDDLIVDVGGIGIADLHNGNIEGYLAYGS